MVDSCPDIILRIIVLIYLIRVRLKNVLKEMNVQTVTQMVQPT